MELESVTGRVAGGLLLAAFACYGAGSALIGSAPGLGALLVLLNSAVVVALAGVVGYAALAAGVALEIAGFGVGLWLSVPGGLFELALGTVLLVRGLPAPAVTPELAAVR